MIRILAPYNLISALSVLKFLRKGCQEFFVLTQDIEAQVVKIEDTQVVNEFVYVFPKGLLRLPPKKEIEFYIDFVLDI